MPTLSPIARVALEALAAFHVEDADQAATLLSMWARRADITDADLSAILATFGGAR